MCYSRPGHRRGACDGATVRVRTKDHRHAQHQHQSASGFSQLSIATVLALIAIALPIAALASRQGVARFAGVIVDPLNGVVPGVQVDLTNVATQATHQVRTDRDGRFEVTGLPPGRYTFQARLPGFATVAGELTVRGVDVERDLRLELGTIKKPLPSPTVDRNDTRPNLRRNRARAARPVAKKTRGPGVSFSSSADRTLHWRQCARARKVCGRPASYIPPTSKAPASMALSCCKVISAPMA